MSEWRICNIHEPPKPEPQYFQIQVPAIAGEYSYHFTKPSSCCHPAITCAAPPTEDTRYRDYYLKIIDGYWLDSYTCKQVQSAYNNAVKEEEEENEKKHNMSAEYYHDYLVRNGFSTDNLSKVPKPKYPKGCTLPHDDEGNHIVYHHCGHNSWQHASHSCHSHAHSHAHNHSCCRH
ncbi:hypothetical protein LPJ53_005060 [Coemansia erecta]|uniref:Uncharacterized protein n=1 Tax=Coemansia erecta TaxID=147472 RepID=A0A9W8CQ89_9FUNG|nr:hypothetical protein LPJ53_005060 [Coemansia erecta]